MEHRYQQLFPADHKTLIFRNGMPVATGRIRNFSRGGVFVQTEFTVVDVNQSLEIELSARGGSLRSDGDSQRCRALVMHKAGGLGLMLREDCVQTQSNLAAFIAAELERSPQAAREAALPQHFAQRAERK